jgi:O-methyltransferase
MTFAGFYNRVRMIPSLIEIAATSLKIGVYCRHHNFRKYRGEFHDLLSNRDPDKGLSVTEEEAYTLYSSVKAVADIPGAIAEFGIYKGATANLICQVKGEKPLYLFDTFEGMPNEKITSRDRWKLNTHKDTTLLSVQTYLKQYEDVLFFQGIFPESINGHPGLEDLRFSFVNVDVDLYESTRQALEFFYPRLNVGGRLVSHNYGVKFTDGGDTPGVKEAFDNYFSEQPHVVIEIAETQCMVIKTS